MTYDARTTRSLDVLPIALKVFWLLGAVLGLVGLYALSLSFSGAGAVSLSPAALVSVVFGALLVATVVSAGRLSLRRTTR
jgi:hypothetical protein